MRTVKHRNRNELLSTLRSMPLFYWMMIVAGVLLSVAYFAVDCLFRPVCR